MLAIGKLPNNMLEALLSRLNGKLRRELLKSPSIGEDCAVLDLGEDLCVLTTDPITGAEKDIGTLAVHVACNDLASSGAEPVGLMVTILAPPAAEFETLCAIMDQIRHEADLVNADIIGGHTEITDAVNRTVISITALGKAARGRVVMSSGAEPGESIILTKYAATEGTAILANMFEDFLSARMAQGMVQKAKRLIGSISVIKEGMIASGFGVSAMHDVTEGGVLGAVWELCRASGCGARIYRERIPVLEETRMICECLGIDPLRLISSGSMLIACPDGEKLTAALAENGIKAALIGETTASNECIMLDAEKVIMIGEPESDELYKARKAAMEVLNGNTTDR
jgi:hydrogenase expression/formation protein HypE